MKSGKPVTHAVVGQDNDFSDLSTVALLEDLLEERTGTDRRLSDREIAPEKDRRLASRRSTDSAP